jgi:hypothetical protein
MSTVLHLRSLGQLTSEAEQPRGCWLRSRDEVPTSDDEELVVAAHTPCSYPPPNMSRSRIHRSERARFRSVYRLVADVTRLGASAEQWTNRLLDGLLELFDAKFTACAVGPLPGRPDEWVRADVSLQRGLTEPELRTWIEGYWAEGRAYRSEFLRRCVAIPARFVTIRRQDVMTDEEWYGSEAFQLIHRPIGLDSQLESHFIVPSQRRLFGMAVHRRLGAPQYTVEDRRQFRRLHPWNWPSPGAGVSSLRRQTTRSSNRSRLACDRSSGSCAPGRAKRRSRTS